MMDYDSRWGRYRINLQTGDLDKYKQLIVEITEEEYKPMVRNQKFFYVFRLERYF